jgi:hypothetical protein
VGQFSTGVSVKISPALTQPGLGYFVKHLYNEKLTMNLGLEWGAKYGY